MSEEEELANRIRAFLGDDQGEHTAHELARALLSSGYAKRGDVVEECARVADLWANANKGRPIRENAAAIASAIRALKEPRE